MQIVILSGPGWHTDELSRALTERGHVARVLPYEGLVAHLGSRLRASGASAFAGAPADRRSLGGAWSASQAEVLSSGGAAIFDADGVLARFIPSGSLEQIVFRIDALHWIEERGVPVMNSPRAIERSVDKFYTDALLREAGLATPEAVVCEGAEPAMAAVRTMLGRRSLDEGGGDVIIKPIFGSMGHGIVRVSDPDVAFRVFQSLEQVRAVFYVQRAVDSGGRDVRVFVVGGKIVGAIERRASHGDWRTNVSRGGSARPLELPAAWASLALRAAAAIGADYAGVDLLPALDGTVFVLEVNGIPGWRGLQRATGVDVAGAIVEHMTTRVQSSRSAAELRA
jgi:RimK family alpha-L-glutamate ligase